MPKKTIIIIIFLLFLVSAGFYVHKSGYFKPQPEGQEWEKYLTFEIKNAQLDQATKDRFQNDFNNVKTQIQKNPDDLQPWLVLGVVKKAVGDLIGARDAWLYAAKIRPQSSTPFANLADLYTYYLGEPQKAEEAYKAAIANDPDDYNFYLGLANLYQYKFSDGNKLYEQAMIEAIDKFPDNPNLIGPLASYFRQTNQVEKAIEWYEKLLKITPDNQMAKEDLEELKKRQK